ncbi:MAG: hypothetical protein OEM82_04030 [Acidobacteriota bacterium]|nr:hypothetical protein [Acidobacteriota bacterium]MDH3530386.1 hypothetical protein [Acidobacteriota bacterium]
MTIKNLGKQVETIWKDLRPLTKEMLVKALNKNFKKQTFSYDAHSDWELSSLLTALDEEVRVKSPDLRTASELRDLAETCAEVLEAQTESAEVFIQLAERALARNDFAKIDKLADVLFERFSAGETAEVIRQTKLAQIRAIAFETLAVLPVTLITPLLDDPLYFDIACNALEQQAIEFESEEARRILEQLEYMEGKDWQ